MNYGAKDNEVIAGRLHFRDVTFESGGDAGQQRNARFTRAPRNAGKPLAPISRETGRQIPLSFRQNVDAEGVSHGNVFQNLRAVIDANQH
jgi:hypothetical protein